MKPKAPLLPIIARRLLKQRRLQPKTLTAACGGLALAALVGQSAQASSDSWTGAVDANWATSGNWLSSPATVPGTGDTATFNGAGNANTVISLGTGVTINNIVFDTASVAAYTIGAGAVGSQTLTLDAGGSVLMNSTVATAQTFNSAVTLGAGAGVFGITNNSTTAGLSFVGNINGAAGAVQTLVVGGAGNTTFQRPINDGTGGTLGLTKVGNGTLRLAVVAGNNDINGPLNITGGILQIGISDLLVGGLSGTGTIENGSATTRWFFVTNATDQTFDGVLQNGAAAGRLGFVKRGPGTVLTLTRTNTYTDNTTVDAGTLRIPTGAQITGGFNNSDSGMMNIGTVNGQNGVLHIDGGTVIANARVGGEVWRSSVRLGTGAGSRGFLKLDSGNLVTARQLAVGGGVNNANQAYAAYSQTGGSATIGGFLAMGLSGASGGDRSIFNQSGGTFTMTTAPATIGAGANGIGVMTLSGNAVYNHNSPGTDNGIWVAETGRGILSLLGNASLTISNNVLQLGRANAATSVGIANLNGGTLTALAVTKPGAAATGVLNFNGGTLKANANNAGFVTGLSGAYIYPNGATIDSGDYTVTVATPLSAPTGDGVSSIAVASGGSGYLEAPLVTIADGSGSGATAIATVSGGVVTGITVTCPGRDYFNGDVLTVTLFGGGGTGATAGAVTFAPNASGGLTKVGNGSLTIDSGSTFAGPLQVTGGTLTLDASSGSSLSVASLSFSNNTSLRVGGLNANPSSPVINVAGGVVAGTNITISFAGGGFSVGKFPVIKYTGTPLPNLNNFKLGALPTGVLTAALVNNQAENQIEIDITGIGQNLTWFGTNNLWDIDTTFNWKNAGLDAKYLEYGSVGDLVRFDDTLEGTLLATNINLTTTLKPAMTVVDSSAYPYVFTGAGSLAGSGSLVKSNTASLTLGTVNTYTGGTFLYGGTVYVSDDSQLGDSAGGLTLEGGNLEYANSAALVRPIAVNAVSSLAAGSGATLQFNGTFSGTGRLDLDGPGTKVLNHSNRLWFHARGGTTILEGNASYTNNINWTSIAPYYDSAVPSADARLILRGNAVFDAGNFDFNVSDSTVAGSGDQGRLDIQDNAVLRFRNLWVGKGLIATGLVYQTGGIVTNFYNAGSDIRIGGNAADQTETFGGYYLSGGRADFRRLVQVGAYGIGELAVSGGQFNNSASVVIGRFTGSRGTVTVSGGSLNVTAGDLVVGENGDGVLTVGGTGVATATVPLSIGGYGAPGVGTVNLNAGGRLIVPQVRMMPVAGSSTFNFDGGTLQAGASSVSFIENLTAANILNGGAIIDSSTNQVTIPQALLGAGSGGVTKIGNGTVRLAGANTYSGPTAVNVGTLYFTPAHQAGGPVTVANGATFGVAASSNPEGALIGNLTLGSGGATTFDFSYPSGNPTAPVLTAGTITINGSATIRIGGVFSVGAFPLFKYSGITGSFAGLAAPRGTTAILSNDVVNKTYYVVITSVGGGIVWTGNTGLTPNLWDIDVTTNWLTGLQPTIYQETVPPGDAVTFTDSGSGTVLLNSPVSPLSVTFSNSAVAYTVSGSGQITALGGLRKLGPGAAAVNVPATFAGDSAISNGTYSVGANHTVGNLSGNGTIGTSDGTPTFTTTNTVATTFSGNTEGAMILAKVGPGNFTLSGTNAHTGGTRVSGGIVNLTGRANQGTAAFTAGHVAGDSVLNLVNELSAGNLMIGNVTGAVAAVYQTAGTVALNGGTGDALNVGNWSGSYGYYNAAGGILNVNGISIGGESNPNGLWPPIGTGNGLMEINGATVTNSGWIVLARGASNQIGVLNVYSGSLTYAGGGIGCNWSLAAGSSDQTSIINILGGSVTSADQGVEFRSDNLGILNLNGGLLKGTAITGAGTRGVVNFNGGTFQTAANSANLLNVASAYIYSKGARIDVAGHAVTLAQSFTDPTGYGVSGIQLTDGGSGYIAPPIVTISGGSGIGATAVAAVSGGAVTQLTITCPGTGYDINDWLTITFTGGGSTVVEPTVGTITFAANTVGNLVKLGTGTLALDAYNTHAGSTIVSNGTLAGVGTMTGPVVVRNGGALAPGNAGIGTFTVQSSPTLQGSVVMEVSRDGGNFTSDLLEAGSAALTYGGTLVLTNVGTEPLQVGDAFKLFNTSGGYGGSFAIVSQTPGQSVTWDTANLAADGTISVATVGAPIASDPTNITATVTSGSINLTWPGSHLGWILQSQTNALNVGLRTNWYDIAGSESVTNVSFPMNRTNPAVFYRLRKP